MSTTKEARRDAEEFARAQMFYGEGAGTRRKLIQATVDSKIARDPEYARVFREEIAKQDMADHAFKARKERKRKDTSQTVSKNVRGILSGQNQGVNASVLVIGTVVYYAHKYGIDKKIADATRKKWRHFRNRRTAKNVVYNITNLH